MTREEKDLFVDSIEALLKASANHDELYAGLKGLVFVNMNILNRHSKEIEEITDFVNKQNDELRKLAIFTAEGFDQLAKVIGSMKQQQVLIDKLIADYALRQSRLTGRSRAEIIEEFISDNESHLRVV